MKTTDYQRILEKKSLLEKVNIQLKSEFIGLDRAIDEITDAVSAWHAFPEIQDKPVVVNLWGLTGVGKTSLVKRLAELLDLQNCYYRFDMGEVNSSAWSMRSQLRDLYEYRNGKTMILAFDEFQNARTKDEAGNELDKPAIRIIWDLLDSGKFQTTRFIGGIDNLLDLIKDLTMCLKSGVVVSCGKVVEKKDVFLKLLKIEEYNFNESNEDGSNDFFVQKDQRDKIYEWIKEQYEHQTEFEKELDALSGRESIDYLYNIYERCFAPVNVDCTKALIFVMGNLDEAYSMSDNFNPDMSADDFHKESLSITISDVKNVLRKRFRNEQIARLGNIHIIYPALSEQSFKSIIDLELKKVSDRLLNLQQLSLDYDDSIKEIIYREGVYPTQGTRPLFTTIHQIIKSKLSKIVCHKELYCKDADRILISCTDGMINIQYLIKNKIVGELSEKMVLNLEVLRKEKKDDNQAIVAVHESGHALVSSLLERRLPEHVYSTTVESKAKGFVFIKSEVSYMSKKDVKLRIATLLGGYAAEAIVYGEENTTLGSGSDIAKATELVMASLKYSGLGKLPMQYSNPEFASPLQLCYSNVEIEEDAKTLVKESLQLAKDVLMDNKHLLLKLSDFLSDNRYIKKEELKKMIFRFAKYNVFEPNFFLENSTSMFYRDHLKKSVKLFPKEPESAHISINPASMSLSLNKESGTEE